MTRPSRAQQAIISARFTTTLADLTAAGICIHCSDPDSWSGTWLPCLDRLEIPQHGRPYRDRCPIDPCDLLTYRTVDIAHLATPLDIEGFEVRSVPTHRQPSGDDGGIELRELAPVLLAQCVDKPARGVMGKWNGVDQADGAVLRPPSQNCALVDGLGTGELRPRRSWVPQ